MKKWLTAVLFGTVLALGACGGGGDDGSEPADDNGDGAVDTANAEDIYKKSCASCHGDDLEGKAGPELANIGSQLSADEIEAVITDGAAGMPAGLIDGDDKTAVANWLAEKK